MKPERTKEDLELRFRASMDKNKMVYIEGVNHVIEWIFNELESQSSPVEILIEFKQWYDKLSPRDKCTVWPPAGSGSGPGLYNQRDEDIVDNFLRKRKKELPPIEETKEK